MDDFCIYSSRLEHCSKVCLAFKQLYEFRENLNPEKCHIAESKVALLGHLVSAEGIHMDPAKVDAVLALPPPSNVKQLRTFVQKVSYLGRFLEDLSQLLSPLHHIKGHPLIGVKNTTPHFKQ